MLLIFFRFILKWWKVEDSGEWGTFIDAFVMSGGAQTSYHKTSILSNPISGMDYIPKPPICQVSNLTKPYIKTVENVRKM